VRQLEEQTCVVRDGAVHREATVRANREGYDSLAGRRIVGVMLITAQGPSGGNACIDR